MRRAIAIAVGAVGLLVAAGCGGGGGQAEQPATSAGTTATSTMAGGTTLQLAADPSGALRFDKKTLEAQAGMVMIELTNESSVPHNVAVEGNGVDTTSDTVTGGSTTLMVQLEPGTYTFYCAVPGHRQAGMEGTLTVR